MGLGPHPEARVGFSCIGPTVWLSSGSLSLERQKPSSRVHPAPLQSLPLGTKDKARRRCHPYLLRTHTHTLASCPHPSKLPAYFLSSHTSVLTVALYPPSSRGGPHGSATHLERRGRNSDSPSGELLFPRDFVYGKDRKTEKERERDRERTRAQAGGVAEGEEEAGSPFEPGAQWGPPSQDPRLRS